MGKGKEISPRKIAEVKALISTKNFSNREVSRRLDISECSVRRIKSKLDFGVDLTPKRKGRCGRKPKFTPRSERRLKKICMENRFATTKHIKILLAESRINASERTVRRKLKELDFKACRPVKKPKLTTAMKAKRIQWAKEHRSKDLDYWRSVLFAL